MGVMAMSLRLKSLGNILPSSRSLLVSSGDPCVSGQLIHFSLASAHLASLKPLSHYDVGHDG